MPSPALGQTILRAKSISERSADSLIEVYHLYIALLSNNDAVARMLQEIGLVAKDVHKALNALQERIAKQDSSGKTKQSESIYANLDKYADNLNVLAAEGKLDQSLVGKMKFEACLMY